MKQGTIIGLAAAWLASATLGIAGQAPAAVPAAQLTERGSVDVSGHARAYLIRRLPASSFPELPEPVANALDQRGCMIPQTYQAHHPENVIHGSFERTGSSDWAVLCAKEGSVNLLVFFSSIPGQAVTVASAKELERLEPHDTSGVLGFNWGIDPATPQQVREAQSGLEHHPSAVDHDALADTVINFRTTYHFYSKSKWTTLEMPE